ncbi:hypothetical protein BT96DRAFT_940494 [Gymnopus androsaceus JB14]|uniref:CNH-domain-containing protein n=1 Tax=Gymnopus androsaceus JB14 TaxID=1447944 RepID=A0A6A4HKA6_9AGAR|nr:hypothetical protein BT96DRAFT_940494 [Gymnopus androsaceus JB14]
MALHRPSSPVVVDQDLQQLYDQVWAGFETEDTQSPTTRSLESATTYTASPYSNSFHPNSAELSARLPRDRPGRGHRVQESADREDISRIYSVYASDAGNNEYRSPTPSNGSYDNHDSHSLYTMSPISPVSSAAATYGRSTRSASTRSNGRDISGSERRLPLPPTPTQGHTSSNPASVPVSSGHERERVSLGVGLPANPRPHASPSPTRDRNERVGRPSPVDVPAYLTADYLPTETPSQPRPRKRSPSPYQENRGVQVINGNRASPSLVVAPLPPSGLPPSPSPRTTSYGDVPKSRSEMNRWNSTVSTFSTTSTIINGVNAQGHPIVPPPPPLPSRASQQSYSMPDPDPYYDAGGPSTIVRRPTDILKDLRGMRDDESEHFNVEVVDDGPSYDYDEFQRADEASSSSARRRRNQRSHRDWTWEYSSDNPDEHNYYSSDEFVNFSLLSHLAVQLRDKVPREVHMKGGIQYERAFTGKDVVDTIQSLIKRHLLLNHSLNLTPSSSYPSTAIDRKAALHVARSLQTQLLFYEVEGGGRELCDGVDDVYMFSDDSAYCTNGNSSSSGFFPTSAELPLPTAVVTMLTRCYVPTCVDDKPCYAWDCPKRGHSLHKMLATPLSRINNNSSSSFAKPPAPYPSKAMSPPVKPTFPAAAYSNSSFSSNPRSSGSSTQSSLSRKLTRSATDDKKPWKETHHPRANCKGDGIPGRSGFARNRANGSVGGVARRALWCFWDDDRRWWCILIFSSVYSIRYRFRLIADLILICTSVMSPDPLLRSYHPTSTPSSLIPNHIANTSVRGSPCPSAGVAVLELSNGLASGEWRAGWGNGWVQGQGFVGIGGRSETGGWTGKTGYDEWVAVWSTCGLGGISVFNNKAGDGGWGNEDWKKIVADQESRRANGEEPDAGGTLPAIDLKRFTDLLALPAMHLQSYPALLSTILAESTSANTVSSSASSSMTNSTNPKANKKRGGKEVESEENPGCVVFEGGYSSNESAVGYGKVKTFQLSMNVGANGINGSRGGMGEPAIKWEWFDLVSEEERKEIGKAEIKRQAIIFELIKGELGYVKDLENVEQMYITPLLNSSTTSTTHHPSRSTLFRIQYDEHPTLRSISAPILDAALNWREAYMEYIPNYPIAAYLIDSQMRLNPAFKDFVQKCTRHPDSHRLDMKNFINRPIPRLLRYELLLKGILEETPAGPVNGHASSSRQSASSSRGANVAEHEDRTAIPQVLDVIRRLGKDTEPGVVSAKSKVELWRYNEGLVFKQGEWIDMDLLDPSRSMIHSGKLLRQTDGLEWSGWTELYVLLFDNYLVLTKPKERDDGTKYHVNRRPIPLDLLTIDSLTEPPVQRSTGPGLLRGLRSQGGGSAGQGQAAGHEVSNSVSNDLLASPDNNTPVDSPSDSASSRLVYPITLYHLGRTTPQTSSAFPTTALTTPSASSSSRSQQKPPPNIILYAESAAARAEWGAKLQDALGIRRVVQESNKVFEVEILSGDTFLSPAGVDGASGGAGGGVLGGWSQDGTITGKVTCSVPFNTADGRGLVAVGCAEGVWIGFRHDPKSMRRVLHLKLVTQCAMLEDYGIFLVLADKSLFAYHIEALVPSSPSANASSQVPQKLNGSKDVHFFTVGTLHGRTLVIYMKKRGLDSIFRVLEPVSEKINERAKAPSGLASRLFVRSPRSEWFKIYRDFFLPSESYDLIFLKATIAILCSKGFEIMNLNDFKSVTIPGLQRDEPRSAYLAKRCESCRPLGMFKSGEDEFLLCYTEFGVYVDKHGDPNRAAGTIEWEGTAERVALHAPYVLLFDSRFIEVRHLETGRLAQIIPGNDIRCTWDGRGISSLNASSPSAQTMSFADGRDEPLNQDAQVHAVMNAPEVVGGPRSRAVVQQLFELLPTVPLFLPESLPEVVGNNSNSSGSYSGGASAYSGSGSGSARVLALQDHQARDCPFRNIRMPHHLRNSETRRRGGHDDRDLIPFVSILKIVDV